MIDAEELGRFNPLTGHGGNGESKIYESLYRVAEGQDDRIPDAVPVLAEGAPEPVDGALTHWRNYSRVATSQYKPQLLARTRELDWNKLTKEVERDIQIARETNATAPSSQTKSPE